MSKLFAAALSLVLFVQGQEALAETKTLGWDDLKAPEAQDFEDPYRNLTYDQLEDLRTIFRARGSLESETRTETQRAEAEATVADAVERLSRDGLDADWILDQRLVVEERRERAAEAVNPRVDGVEVSMPGYAIGAPPGPDGLPVVYLVPERGMCSHMPPPDPNQMIRARIASDWQPRYIHEPVRLTGTLIAEDTRHAFHVVDWLVQMRSSFVMDVTRIDTYCDMFAPPQQGNDWAAKLAEKTKANAVVAE